jgi:hypothetical protein
VRLAAGFYEDLPIKVVTKPRLRRRVRVRAARNVRVASGVRVLSSRELRPYVGRDRGTRLGGRSRLTRTFPSCTI